MKLTFHIDYNTTWGESVFLVGDINELGNNNLDNALRLSYDNHRRRQLRR